MLTAAASIDLEQSRTAKLEACDDLKMALEEGSLGEIVAKHEKLITNYYTDVQQQAGRSFESAKAVAKIGFWVLIGTLLYVVLADVLGNIRISNFTMPSLELGTLGIVSGALIEFIAAINFWLYSRASKQFTAFHICLERTHRYLLAYRMVDALKTRRDETLEKLVCIMANAPMIGATIVDATDAGTEVPSVT